MVTPSEDEPGLRVAYFGPAGTFTEEAARRHAPKAELIPYPTIAATAGAVASGAAEQAVVPIENSLQGAVTDTLDVLIHGEGTKICREIVLAIVHNLVARPGTAPASIQTVYSHPQALGQCRYYLERNYPKAALAASLSTAAAVEQAMASDGGAAAIAPRRAAEIYGAEVLAEGIQDAENNVTRFVALATRDHAPTGDDKTSVCFSFDEDKPGQLLGVMTEFAERNLNLSKIESRPTRLGLGQYYFLVDIDGHREDAAVAEALEGVRAKCAELKVFGSYPRSPSA